MSLRSVLGAFGIAAMVTPALSQQADRILSGYGYAVDGETLAIGADKIRLATIVAPALADQATDRVGRSYPAGPFARDVLASLVAEQSIGCRATPINGRDRDSEGRIFAICSSSSTADLAAELVKRGWAVLDRIKGVPVYASYKANEAAAKTSGRGLWQGKFLAQEEAPEK